MKSRDAQTTDVLRRPSAIGREVDRVLAMPFTLERDAQKIEISIPMTGVRPQDVSIFVDGHTLSVTLTVDHEVARGCPGSMVQEKHAGAASRIFTLAVPFDAGAASACLEHGVLHVRLPAGDERRCRQIQLD